MSETEHENPIEFDPEDSRRDLLHNEEWIHLSKSSPVFPVICLKPRGGQSLLYRTGEEIRAEDNSNMSQSIGTNVFQARKRAMEQDKRRRPSTGHCLDAIFRSYAYENESLPTNKQDGSFESGRVVPEMQRFDSTDTMSLFTAQFPLSPKTDGKSKGSFSIDSPCFESPKNGINAENNDLDHIFQSLSLQSSYTTSLFLRQSLKTNDVDPVFPVVSSPILIFVLITITFLN